jgi:hypothetical protein
MGGLFVVGGVGDGVGVDADVDAAGGGCAAIATRFGVWVGDADGVPERVLVVPACCAYGLGPVFSHGVVLDGFGEAVEEEGVVCVLEGVVFAVALVGPSLDGSAVDLLAYVVGPGGDVVG